MLSKARPYENPDNYVHQAHRLARRLATIVTEGVLYANQWDKLANRDGHMASTGPEIWAQTGAASTPSSAQSARAGRSPVWQNS